MLLALLGGTLLGAGLKFEEPGEDANREANPASAIVLGGSNAPSSHAKATNTVGAFVLPEGSVVEDWAPPPPRNVVPRDVGAPAGDPSQAAEQSWAQIGLALAIVLAIAAALGLLVVAGRLRRK